MTDMLASNHSYSTRQKDASDKTVLPCDNGSGIHNANSEIEDEIQQVHFPEGSVEQRKGNGKSQKQQKPIKADVSKRKVDSKPEVVLNAKAKWLQAIIIFYCVTRIYESGQQLKEEGKHEQAFILYQAECRRVANKLAFWVHFEELSKNEFSMEQLMLKKGQTIWTPKELWSKGMSTRKDFTAFIARYKSEINPMFSKLKTVSEDCTVDPNESDEAAIVSEKDIVVEVPSGKSLDISLEKLLLFVYNDDQRQKPKAIVIDEDNGECKESSSATGQSEITEIDDLPPGTLPPKEFTILKYFGFKAEIIGVDKCAFITDTLCACKGGADCTSYSDATSTVGKSRKDLKSDNKENNSQARLSTSALNLQAQEDHRLMTVYRSNHLMEVSALAERRRHLENLKPYFESQGTDALIEKYYVPMERLGEELKISEQAFKERFNELEGRHEKRKIELEAINNSAKVIKVEQGGVGQNKNKNAKLSTPSPTTGGYGTSPFTVYNKK